MFRLPGQIPQEHSAQNVHSMFCRFFRLLPHDGEEALGQVALVNVVLALALVARACYSQWNRR